MLNTLCRRCARPLRTQTGFTLIELVVVVIIIGILAAASVPIYKGYIKKATLAEGRSIAGSIATGQKLYYLENNKTYAIATSTTMSTTLGLEATGGKYFSWFSITTAGAVGPTANYTALITGTGTDASGVTVTVIQTMNGYPTIDDNL